MVHHNNYAFTSSAEVSIFSAKEIVGASGNNIVHEIPCSKNRAGDFCIYNICIAFAEKGKAAQFGTQAKLFSAKDVNSILHASTETAIDINSILHASAETAIDVNSILQASTETAMDVNSILHASTETAMDVNSILHVYPENVLYINGFRISKHNLNKSISIN
jgi:hypothetical protein